MQVGIPTNHRQAFRWVGDLDAPSLFALCAGIALALSNFHGSGSVVEKLLVAAMWFLLGAFFAFAKWPVERGGDKMWTWAVRVSNYLRRPRRGSVFEGLALSGPIRAPKSRGVRK